MYWNRVELKNKAKKNFKRQYWPSVLSAFLLTVFVTMQQGDTLKKAWHYHGNGFNEICFAEEGEPHFLWFAGSGLVLIGIVGLLIKIFVLNPFEVGGKKFFVANGRGENPQASVLLDGFTVNYENVVKTLFLRDLYLCLWTLCLVIPGIIKGYEYYQIPYLLADNPNTDTHEVFETSRKMMDGSKLDTFVLELSFLGWNILNLFTFNLLNLFYVAPYEQATYAQLYLALSQQ